MGFSYSTDNISIPINMRKVNYNFTELDGIIFGINTTKEDKIKILSVLNEKYKKENHPDLKIYQAYYKNNTGKIECERIALKTSVFKSN